MLEGRLGFSQCFWSKYEGKLKGNSVIITLRGNNLKVSSFKYPSPGILVALLRAGSGFRQGFWAKLSW
jgi:hypothetical protein